MAASRTQGATGNGSTIALTSVASGALLTLQTSYFRGTGTGAAESTPTDSQGTWSNGAVGVPGRFGSIFDGGASIFYQEDVASGTHTVTPQANTSKNLTLTEWAGVATASSLDGTANSHTDAASFTSQVTGTTATTAQADEVSLIALGLAANVGSSDVGFTDPVSGYTTLQKVSNDLSDMGTFHAYKILSATGTQSATFNWTDSESDQLAGACIATFKAAGGGSSLVPRLSLLGAG